jgi:prephenate dehydrogenase
MSQPLVHPRRTADAGEPPFARVGIVGLGLIGGSIALAVRELWPSAMVVAVDRKDVLETAMRLHAVDVAADDLVVLAEVDLVILAAPVRQNLALLPQLGAHITQPAIVTDTGSTKRDIVLAARSLPDHLTFVGGHPLGGAAVGGLEHARPDLFRRRPWLFTPTPSTPADVVERLAAFAAALGSTPRIVTAEEHDRLLAFLSHLPQITASALMTVVGEGAGAEALSMAGRGLADTTRLASSPADIWRDIAASNADQIGPALDALIAVLQTLRDDLPTGSRLGEIFDAAGDWRNRLTHPATL